MELVHRAQLLEEPSQVSEERTQLLSTVWGRVGGCLPASVSVQHKNFFKGSHGSSLIGPSHPYSLLGDLSLTRNTSGQYVWLLGLRYGGQRTSLQGPRVGPQESHSASLNPVSSIFQVGVNTLCGYCEESTRDNGQEGTVRRTCVRGHCCSHGLSSFLPGVLGGDTALLGRACLTYNS